MPQTPSLPQPSYTLEAFQAEYKLPLVQAVSWYDPGRQLTSVELNF